jgi:large subunit ribosomal protein L30e
MIVDDIKKLIKSESMIIGSDRVIKALRKKDLEKIFLASNAPPSITDDIKHYAGLTGTPVEQLEVPNDELGVVCKKPFSISVLGLKKAVEKKKH